MTETLITAMTALQRMVVKTEGNETPDSGYLSRRKGIGGIGFGHSDIMDDQVGLGLPRGACARRACLPPTKRSVVPATE